MKPSVFGKAGILAVILVLVTMSAWEIYLRSQKVAITFDDGQELWADKRRFVSLPADQATVFIGASRHKFDLDVSTWESLTGEKVIQLAEVGSSPKPVLHDLAMDESFKGKLVIDITEPISLSIAPQVSKKPLAYIKYAKERTPAQRASFFINKGAESNFVFLDKNYLSLNGLLTTNVHLPNRPGVFTMPYECPIGFNRTSFDRQSIMTEKFAMDTVEQFKVKSIWKFYRGNSKAPPLSGPKLDSLLASYKADIDQLRSRGVVIIFVRTPSSGPMLQGEQAGFPRDKYWDRLLSVTGQQGIHFQDFPSLSHFVCPETSHLNHRDAIAYTTGLISILETNYGWKFPHKPGATVAFNYN